MGNENKHRQIFREENPKPPRHRNKANQEQRTSTKYRVLAMLREAAAPLSGEIIAAEAGVSRVSVWKAVQALQEAGYGIEADGKGYVLSRDAADSLFPWEFGDKEYMFHHYGQISSTMDKARFLAEHTESAFAENHSPQKHTETAAGSSCFIVTADHQTKARGCGTHAWESVAGGLFFTLAMRPEITAGEAQRSVMAAQIALADTLKEITGRQFFLRWPNDIWSEKGKVSGVLDEMSVSGGSVNWLNIGIGINIRKKPDLQNTDAVFSDETANRNARAANQGMRKKILCEFLKKFEQTEALALENSAALAKRWNSLCPDTGHSLRLAKSGETALFLGINDYGWARIVRGADMQKISAGTNTGIQDESFILPGKQGFVKTQRRFSVGTDSAKTDI
ncbi:MAG: biotin--[acetyl-CoA-carboxylase] ligase [Bacteroides sp.]|nr:biotin--[acetyl-CoA-carboxylase] ligase [Prevotella sp.]MCM1408099.1 biotin--[acetyl-CoA-carboxylase] ligase [Treponema brennaborense]MCM1469075.1 biotin--[acetyl-CoA-carboxylase] ligase [Bacteroides sp.]